jgi:hypothetical protein
MLKYGKLVVSPYYANFVPAATLNGGLYSAHGSEHIDYNNDNVRVIVGGGFIHAYSDLKVAKEELAGFNEWAHLYKCVIPAGTRYFRSVPEDHEICAKEIRFVEEVK